MFRMAFIAAAAITPLLITDAALAQDPAAGIWAARPRPRRVVQESVPASTLPGLAPGLAVQTSGGRAIGRVSQVVTNNDGSIRKVMVVSPVGNLFKLSPTTLSISDGVVTTTEERNGS